MSKIFLCGIIVVFYIISMRASNTFADLKSYSGVMEYGIDDCNPSSQYPDGTDCSYRGDRSFLSTVDNTTQFYWLDMPDNYDSVYE